MDSFQHSKDTCSSGNSPTQRQTCSSSGRFQGVVHKPYIPHTTRGASTAAA
jgi:hypothetical protein